MAGPCLRSATCRCDDCAAAMEMFSAKDLIAVSSSSVFDEDGDAGGGGGGKAIVEENVVLKKSANDSVSVASAAASHTSEASSPADATLDPAATLPAVGLTPAGGADPLDAGAPPAEELFDDLSLDELLEHSNWKARKVGYSKLKTELEADNALAGSRFSALERLLSESMLGAMESALQCAALLVLLEYKAKDNGELARSSVTRMQKTCMPATKSSVKAAGVEVVLSLMAAGMPAMNAAWEALKAGVGHKNVKVQTSSLEMARASVNAFGARFCPSDLLMQTVDMGLGQRMVGVKKEATALAVDTDAWMEGGFKSLITTVIQSEATNKAIGQALDKAADKRAANPPTLEPTRSVAGAKAPVVATAGVDVFDLMEATQLLPKLGSELKFATRIKAAKWLERKNALDVVIAACGNPPKLAKGEYGDLVRTLRGLVQNDSNQAVVVRAIDMLGTLGAGLRSEFRSSARAMMSQLLQKYRDKKAPLVSAVDTALEIFAKHCFNLTEDNVVAAVSDAWSFLGEGGKQKSTPLQRTNMARWLAKCLTSGFCWGGSPSITKAFELDGFKTIINIMASACGDADQKVRDFGATCLGTLKYVTEGMSEECKIYVTTKVDDVVKKTPKLKSKIEESAGTGATSAVSAAPTAKLAVAAATAAAATAPAESTAETKPARGPQTSLLARRPDTLPRMPAATPVTASSIAASSSEDAVTDDSNPMINEEEATAIVKGLGVAGLNEALETCVDSIKWQDRLAVFTVLDTFIAEQESLGAEHVNALLSFVCGAPSKNLKESNFNVINGAWKCCRVLAEKGHVPRNYAKVLLTAMQPKLGDRKQAPEVKALALSLCESCGPRYIVANFMAAGTKIVSPKAVEDLFRLLGDVVRDFGAGALKSELNAICEFCAGAKGLGNRAMPTKVAATELLTELYKQVGDPIQKLLPDTANAQLAAKFEEVGYQGPQLPTRKVKDDVEDAEGEVGGGVDGSALDDLLPRADVSGLLNQNLLDNLGDESTKTAWKVRQKAILDVIAIVQDAKGRIQFNRAVRETMSELRKRLNDSNGNLVIKALDAMAALVKASGSEGAIAMAKGNVSAIANCLNGKNAVVVATDKALNVWCSPNDEDKPDHGAFLAVLAQLDKAMREPRNSRKTLLQLIVGHFTFTSATEAKQSMCQLSVQEIEDVITETTGPLLDCLQTKHPTERKLAIQCISLVVRFLGPCEGPAAFSARMRDLKPAVVRMVQPMLTQAYEIADTGEKVAESAAPTISAPVEKKSSLSTLRRKKPENGMVKSAQGASGSNAAALAAPEPASPEPEDSGMSYRFKEVPAALRNARQLKGTRTRWPAMFDEKDKRRMKEYHEELKVDFSKVIDKPMLELMFQDADSGRAARGSALDPAFQALKQQIPEQPHESLEAFDLLLKWSTLQLLNNNSTVTINILALLDQMFEMAASSGFELTDYEALLFVPHLLRKLGEKQQRFRESVRGIMRLIPVVYSKTKYMVLVFNECSAHQRSTHILSECLDEMARLTRDYFGAKVAMTKVSMGNDVLRSIIPLVGDSRKEVRGATLVFAEAIWEDLFRDTRALFALMDKRKATPSDKIKVMIGNYLTTASNKPATRGPDGEDVVEEPATRGAVVAPRGQPPNRKLKLATHEYPPACTPGRKAAHPSTTTMIYSAGGAVAMTSPVDDPPSPCTPKHQVIMSYNSSTTDGERNTSARKTFEMGISTFNDFAMPSTPPSPSDRKRINNEKENHPTGASDGLGAGMFNDELVGLTPTKQYSNSRSSKSAKLVRGICGDIKAYEELLRSNDVSPSAARDRGIASLTLLGARDPPDGWEKDQQAWVKLLASDLDAPRVISAVLNLLAHVTESAQLEPVIALGGSVEADARAAAAQREIRLLKLLLPGNLTLAWWPELREAVATDPEVCARWVKLICDLVSRLLQQRVEQLTVQEEEVVSEVSHDIQSERDRLLKTVQTVFAKLSELPTWLPAVLARMTAVRITISGIAYNPSAEEHRLLDSERRLRRVLRSSLSEFVTLQETLLGPYEGVDIDATLLKMHDLLIAQGKHQQCPSDGDESTDVQAMEGLVRSMIKFPCNLQKHLDYSLPTIAGGPVRVLYRRVIAESLSTGNGVGSNSNMSAESEDDSIAEQKRVVGAIFEAIAKAYTVVDTKSKMEAEGKLRTFAAANPDFDTLAVLEASNMSTQFKAHIRQALSGLSQQSLDKKSSRFSSMMNKVSLFAKSSSNKNVSTSVAAAVPLSVPPTAAAPPVSDATPVSAVSPVAPAIASTANGKDVSIDSIRQRMMLRKKKLLVSANQESAENANEPR